MRRKPYPIKVRLRARTIVAAWEQIGPTVMLGSVSNTALLAKMMQAETIERQIRTAELQLASLRNERDAVYLSLWDQVKRVYASVSALYGDDSIQYEMVGRTRASKRKRRSHKTVFRESAG
jgi:hypothetical protein